MASEENKQRRPLGLPHGVSVTLLTHLEGAL